MNKRIVYLTLCMAIFLPIFAYAGPIIRSGESISIDAAQVLKGDFYGLASTVTMSGTAENDAYIAGGTVTINAPVQQDLTVAAGTLQVHSEVGDDIRVVGGEVTLGNHVKGDVVVIGGALTVLSTAQIEGDILFMGGSLVVEGDVIGNIHGTADSVRINNQVGGDILLQVGSLFTLGDNANVIGSVSYESRHDVVRAQNAQVGGNIRKTEVSMDGGEGSALPDIYFFQLGILLFASCSFYFIAKGRVQHAVSASALSPGMSGLIGLGVFLIVPFIGGVLLISLLGMLAGIMLLTLYIALLVLAIILAGVFVGYQLEKHLMKTNAVTIRTVILGVLAFSLLPAIPYIGELVMFACVVIMLGTLSQTLYHSIKA